MQHELQFFEVLNRPAGLEPPSVKMEGDEIFHGRAFLRRALGVAATNPTQQVVIKTGRLDVTYEHRAENENFTDGVSQVHFRDGITPDSMASARGTMERFRSVADDYSVSQGLEELGLK